MPKVFQSSLNPFRFLRVVASEYLAAYQLSGNTPVSSICADADDWPNSYAITPETATLAPVVDIATHPRFDGSQVFGAATARPLQADGNRTSVSLPVRSA